MREKANESLFRVLRVLISKEEVYSEDIDALVGLNIMKSEQNRTDVKGYGQRLTSSLGEVLWSENREDAYSSRYDVLNWIVKYVENLHTRYNDKPVKIIDVGAGYGRLGIVCALHYNIHYIGYEFVPKRVKTANKVFEENKMHNCKVIEQDLSDKDFTLPKAEAYYMYEPVNTETLKKLLKEIPSGALLFFNHAAQYSDVLTRDKSFRVVAKSPNRRTCVYVKL